ncbi:MAG: hypothetical protein ACR2IE_19940 [Candidatus Sumerlaeaceae bacterium]
MKFYLRFGAAVVVIALIVWLLMEFGQRDAPAPVAVAVSPAPTPVPTPAIAPVPRPVQAPISQPTLPAFIPRAALGAHVTITGTRRVDDWWYVTAVGRDRNALNDFLDIAYKSGLRDLDVNYQDYKQFIVRGQQRSQNTFKMRF